jgi:Cu/Ag efflux protein CusF
MVRHMMAATAVLAFVVGLSTAADEKKADPNQVTGKLVKFDADKGEITISVKDKDMTYSMAKDAKVSVGEVREVKDLSKLKAGQLVRLTLQKDGDKNMVIEVMEAKPNGSGKN